MVLICNSCTLALLHARIHIHDRHSWPMTEVQPTRAQNTESGTWGKTARLHLGSCQLRQLLQQGGSYPSGVPPLLLTQGSVRHSVGVHGHHDICMNLPRLWCVARERHRRQILAWTPAAYSRSEASGAFTSEDSGTFRSACVACDLLGAVQVAASYSRGRG